MAIGERINTLILRGRARVSTGNRGGAALEYPATHPYGEMMELRANVAFTASQFQALFVRVSASSGVANTSTLRGAEIDARNASGQNAGSVEGVHASASVKGAGTVDSAFGVTGQVSLDADVAAEVTLLAALRAKIQTEDAATITEGYGVLIENEFVTGGKRLTAAIGIRSTGEGDGFGSLIDSRGTGLEVINTNQVRLMAFLDAAGTDKMLVYDPDSATAVSVANYA